MGLQSVTNSNNSIVFCLTCYSHLSDHHQIINYRVHNKISLVSPSPRIHHPSHTKPHTNALTKYNATHNLLIVKKVYCKCCSTLVGFRVEKSFKSQMMASLNGRIYFNCNRVVIDMAALPPASTTGTSTATATTSI